MIRNSLKPFNIKSNHLNLKIIQTWFEVNAKYTKVDQDGRERNVSDVLLIDAVSCTDAEQRAIKVISEQIRGESIVTKISQSNIIEVFPAETGEYWWKAKINILIIDERAGKEKKINNYFLVAADDLKEARERLESGLSYVLVPYHVESISRSRIVDVYPYFEEETTKKSDPVPVACYEGEDPGEIEG